MYQRIHAALVGSVVLEQCDFLLAFAPSLIMIISLPRWNPRCQSRLGDVLHETIPCHTRSFTYRRTCSCRGLACVARAASGWQLARKESTDSVARYEEHQKRCRGDGEYRLAQCR